MEPYQFQPPGPVFDSASINSLDEAAEAMEWRLKTPYRTLKMQEVCMVKFSLECALNWWQGMLGRIQGYQYAGVIACHLGVLLPSHEESFQRGRLNIILHYHSYPVATSDIEIQCQLYVT